MNTIQQNKIDICHENIIFLINNETKKYTIKLQELVNNKITIDQSLDDKIIAKIIRKTIKENDYNIIVDNNVSIKIQYFILDEEINITINIDIDEFKNNYEKILDLDQKEKDKLLIDLLKRMENLEQKQNKLFNTYVDLKEINLTHSTLSTSSIISLNVMDTYIRNRNNYNNIRLIRIYMANNGNFKDFHKFCDNINNTICICKIKNHIIGRYTQITWETNDNEKYYEDNNAFLFAIIKQKICAYDIKDSTHAIYQHKDMWCCCFGGHYELWITCDGRCYCSGNITYSTNKNDESFLAKEHKAYDIDVFEVFKIVTACL